MYFSKEQILLNVKISDVAESVGISLEEVNTGNFTHRCKCPSPDHKGGLERTGSLYIDDDRNNFYCFGCNASNNVIDFYILCTDKTFSESIKELSTFVDKKNLKRSKTHIKNTIFSVLLEISHYYRGLLRAHPDDMEWIELMMKKTDEYISEIDRYDIDSAKKLMLNIKKSAFRRYNKK
jgi:DNA primase